MKNLTKKIAVSACALCAVCAFAGCGEKSTEAEGKIYSLQEAYDNGFLTQTDLEFISYCYGGGVAPENYLPQLVQGSKFVELYENIKLAYYNQDFYVQNGKTSATVDDVIVGSCYGAFGSNKDCYAISISINYPDLRVEPFEYDEIEIGGVTFYDYSSIYYSISVYKIKSNI